MTRLLLVRHGQSEWNAAGRWQGRADPPLSDLGERQARHAAATVPDYDLLVSSTLQRAIQTARAIATERSTDTDDVHLDDRLVERDVGEFSGLTRDEIDERYPEFRTRGIHPPGWEPEHELVARVTVAIHTIAATVTGGVVLVVTHGGIIYTIERLFGLPHERIPNLGGRWLQARNGDLALGPRVHLLDAHEETTPRAL